MPADQNPADQNGSDRTPADQNRGAETGSDRTPTGQNRGAQTGSDRTSADQNRGAETGSDRTPTGQNRGARQPADRIPADGIPADRIPADGIPADRTPADQDPRDRDPVDHDVLMAAIAGEALPPGAGAEVLGAHRAAVADLALLREQMQVLGRALGEPPAPVPDPVPEPAPAPRRRRSFRLALGVLAAACAGVVAMGGGWLVLRDGVARTADSATSASDKSAAGPERAAPPGADRPGLVFGTPAYLACARLVAEGTVLTAEPVPGRAQHRITLLVSRSYVPDRNASPVTVLLDDALARLHPGDQVLVGALRDRPALDAVVTGPDIATLRAWITASLPSSRTRACE